MTSKCDICFDECPDKLMVRLVKKIDGVYARCCCCNINICVRCAMTMQKSVMNECPLCRTFYEIYVFNDLVGTDGWDENDGDAFDAHDRRVIQNKYDKYIIAIIDGMSFAVLRSDKDRGMNYIDLHAFESYNRKKKELMMSRYDIRNPVGVFDSSKGKLILNDGVTLIN
jgi:hypothetical protein